MNPSTHPNRDFEFRDDPHLGRVPTDWKTAKLGQLLCDCQYGLSRQLADIGKYPVFRMNNIKDGRMVAHPLAYIDLPEAEFARYRLTKGDILLNRTNSLELVGKVGLFDLDGDFLFASYLIRLAVSSPNDSRFVNYFLNSYQGQKRIRSKVTPAISQANVNTRSLKSVWLPQPSPDEQRLIADTLDELHDLTEAYREKIAALELLQKALMRQLLTGRMKPDGTPRHQCEFQETKLGLLPKDWTAARVKDFGPVSTGKTPPTVNEANFGRDYPFITPGDMGDTKWVRETERSLSTLGADYVGVLPPSAVCVVCIGATIGKVGLTVRPACTNQQVNSVVCANGHSHEYLYYALRYRARQLQLIAGVNATPQLNKSDFSKYRLPMPATSEEEAEIGARLAVFDDLVEAKKQKIAALQGLKKSLMQNLLTGRIRLSGNSEGKEATA